MEVKARTDNDMQVPAPLDLVRGRLAELVVHLSDCEPGAAIAAIRDAAPEVAPADHDGRLAIVAAALLRVRDHVDITEAPATSVSGPAHAATAASAER